MISMALTACLETVHTTSSMLQAAVPTFILRLQDMLGAVKQEP